MIPQALLLTAWAQAAMPEPMLEDTERSAPVQNLGVEDGGPGAQEPDSVTVDTADVEGVVPAATLETIEREVQQRLRAHGFDPSSLSLRIGWHDRDRIVYGIWIITDAQRKASSCIQCSDEELGRRILTLVDQALLDVEASRAPKPPPPASLTSTAESPVADTSSTVPRDHRWPLRRGLAAALVAAGSVAVITGTVLAAVQEHEVIVEKGLLGNTVRRWDFRPWGYTTLGIGAAALVGGVVWLVVEQRRRPERASVQSRIRPGAGCLEVTF